MNGRRANTGGWILLETLVALAVLSIGIIAVNRALGEALVSRALARDYTEATFYLRDVMGRLKVQPQIPAEASGEGVCDGSDGRFQYRWTAEVVPFGPPQGQQPLPPRTGATTYPVQTLGRLRVTISWTRQGQPYELTSETLVQPERIWTAEADAYGTRPEN